MFVQVALRIYKWNSLLCEKALAKARRGYAAWIF
jgi:hypothetical protein